MWYIVQRYALRYLVFENWPGGTVANINNFFKYFLVHFIFIHKFNPRPVNTVNLVTQNIHDVKTGRIYETLPVWHYKFQIKLIWQLIEELILTRHKSLLS